MTSQVKVSLSGPVFSFLLYENTKSAFQQEGLLIGDIIHKQRKAITDNDQIQVNHTKIIKIKSVVPLPQGVYLCNNTGKTDRDKLEDFLGPQFKKVVAWYKYKKNSKLTLTLREKMIHKQLAEMFEVPTEVFTCCLLLKESSDNCSTHKYEQAFIRWHNYSYDKVPIQISNLGEPNNTYKSSDETVSPTFNKILKGLKMDLKKTQGLVVINKIHNALQKHIDSMVGDLASAEKELFQLEQEVQDLREKEKIRKEFMCTDSNSEQDKIDDDNDTCNFDDLVDSQDIEKKTKS